MGTRYVQPTVQGVQSTVQSTVQGSAN